MPIASSPMTFFFALDRSVFNKIVSYHLSYWPIVRKITFFQCNFHSRKLALPRLKALIRRKCHFTTIGYLLSLLEMRVCVCAFCVPRTSNIPFNCLLIWVVVLDIYGFLIICCLLCHSLV